MIPAIYIHLKYAHTFEWRELVLNRNYVLCFIPDMIVSYSYGITDISLSLL